MSTAVIDKYIVTPNFYQANIQVVPLAAIVATEAANSGCVLLVPLAVVLPKGTPFLPGH